MTRLAICSVVAGFGYHNFVSRKKKYEIYSNFLPKNVWTSCDEC